MVRPINKRSVPEGHKLCPTCKGKRIRTETTEGRNKTVHNCAKCLGIGYVKK